MVKFWQGYIALAVALFAVVALVPLNDAKAFGVEQECFIATPTTSTSAMDSNDLGAQTFIASSSYSIGAIKLNLYRLGADYTLRAFIVETSGVSPNAAPDMNNVLGSEQFTTNLLPEFDGVTAANNTFSCDPTVDEYQVIEFDPPVPVTFGQQYGLVVEYDSGATGSQMWAWPWSSTTTEFSNGHAYDCNVSTSCTRLTPGTWDLISGGRDQSFAVFDNIVVYSEVNNADTWLENFLRDFLGLNSTTGKLIFGVGFTLVIVIGLLAVKVPFIVALGFGGFMAATAGLAALIPINLIMAMVAIVGVGLLISIVGFSARESSEG